MSESDIVKAIRDCLTEKKYNAAIDLLRTLLEVEPDSVAARRWLTEIYTEKLNSQGACQVLDREQLEMLLHLEIRLLEEDPTSKVILSQLAMICARLGLKKASEYYMSLISNHST